MTKEGEKTPLAPMEKPAGHHQGQGWFLRHITMISRLTGLAVLALLWSATVTTLQGNVDTPTYVGYYLLAATIVITFFEITWVLDKLACCVREGCCCRCWSAIIWVDGWPKFVLYSALSVPLFIQGMKGIIDIVSGFCLLILAVLYLTKSISRMKHRPETNEHEPIPGETKPSVVAKHEISTQSDVTSVTIEHSDVGIQTSQHPRNPFDEAVGIDLDEVDESTLSKVAASTGTTSIVAAEARHP